MPVFILFLLVKPLPLLQHLRKEPDIKSVFVIALVKALLPAFTPNKWFSILLMFIALFSMECKDLPVSILFLLVKPLPLSQHLRKEPDNRLSGRG